jgi:hypothetical protein
LSTIIDHENCESVGDTGNGFTVTAILFDVVLPQLLVVVTEYVPPVVTVMFAVVAAEFQVPPLFPISNTESPEQIVVLPNAEIVDAVGNGFTVTKILFEVVLPQAFVVVTE